MGVVLVAVALVLLAVAVTAPPLAAALDRRRARRQRDQHRRALTAAFADLREHRERDAEDQPGTTAP